MTPPAGLLPRKISYASDPAESNPEPLEDTQIGEMEAAVNEELCETHIENSESMTSGSQGGLSTDISDSSEAIL